MSLEPLPIKLSDTQLTRFKNIGEGEPFLKYAENFIYLRYKKGAGYVIPPHIGGCGIVFDIEPDYVVIRV